MDYSNRTGVECFWLYAYVCVCTHVVGLLKIRLVLWDLIEPLPWIERDISKAWHGGQGLLLSLHRFIYHPKVCVCVCVCVFTYLGLSHGCLCLTLWTHVSVRVREVGESWKCDECVRTHVPNRCSSGPFTWYSYHKDSDQFGIRI